jgi:hypothetical protein
MYKPRLARACSSSSAEAGNLTVEVVVDTAGVGAAAAGAGADGV